MEQIEKIEKIKQETKETKAAPKSTALDLFSKLCLEFIDALSSVFDDDPVLQKVKLKMNVAIGDMNVLGDSEQQKKDMIASWHKSMEPYYEEVNKRNSAIFAQIEETSKSLKEIGINKKYHDPSIDNDTRECIWDYVCGICKYSQMYFLYEGIPTGMMSKLTDIASQLTTDIENGKGMQDLDIMGLGKQVAESINPEDMKDFTQNMMQNMSTVTSLASSVIGESQNEDSPLGGLDLGGLSGMMGFLGKMMPK